MRKGKHWLIYAILLLVHLTNDDARAQWFAVKRSLQKDVQITEETATRLVLYHPAFGVSLVLTATPSPEADVYHDREARRGGNPYRVWVTTEKFWQTPLLAEDAGKKFFHAGFARTLRRPPEKSTLPIEQNLLAPPAAPAPHEIIAETAKPRSTMTQPLLTLETEPAAAIADSTAVSMRAEEIHAPNIDSASSRIASLDNRPLAPSNQASPDKRAQEKTPTADEMIEPAPEPKPSDPAIIPILPQAEKAPPQAIDSAASLPEEALTMSRAGDEHKYLYWGGALAAIIILPLLGFGLFSPTMRARFYVLRGNNETAAAIYEKLLERHPQRLELYSHLTQLYLLLGRQDAQALKVFKIILQLNIPTPYRQQLNEIVAKEQLTDGKATPSPLDMLKESRKSNVQKKASGNAK